MQWSSDATAFYIDGQRKARFTQNVNYLLRSLYQHKLTEFVSRFRRKRVIGFGMYGAVEILAGRTVLPQRTL